jgi:hypothetical protein
MSEEIKKELSLIEKAEAVALRIEEANKKAEELLRRQEEIKSKKLLAGRSEAGDQQAPIIDPELEAKTRINNILKGTGLTI